MNTDWKEFLSGQGAKFNADRLSGFPNHENIGTNELITDLSHLAQITITGNAAEAFLHGQFTINIKTLAEHHLQFSAWCNPKGQVKVTFLIYRDDDGFTILCPAELKDNFIKQLRMYIMRSNVTVTDHSDDLVRLGVQIHDTTTLKQFTGSLPAQENDVVINDGIHCLSVHNTDEYKDTQRYILIATADQQISLWEALVQKLNPVASTVWEYLDIQSAYPWLTTATTEKFLPQMLNLDLIDGLNYQKGCYPGQEIIARLHFRGQVKRRLYLASCDADVIADTEIKSGVQLFTNDADDKSIGSVINAQASSDKYYFLAVIDNEVIEQQIHIANTDGSVIHIEQLPYDSAPV